MSTTAPNDRVQELSDRASRQWLKGNHKKALSCLREACFAAGEDARLWALYGARLAAFGRVDEASHALRQAVFFRKAARDEARVRSTESVLARLRLAA